MLIAQQLPDMMKPNFLLKACGLRCVIDADECKQLSHQKKTPSCYQKMLYFHYCRRIQIKNRLSINVLRARLFFARWLMISFMSCEERKNKLGAQLERAYHKVCSKPKLITLKTIPIESAAIKKLPVVNRRKTKSKYSKQKIEPSLP